MKSQQKLFRNTFFHKVNRLHPTHVPMGGFYALPCKIDEELAKNEPKNVYNINTKDTEIHKRLREAIVNLINQGGSLLKKIVADKMPNSSLDEQDVVYSKKLSIFLKRHMFIKESPKKIIDVEKTYRAIIKDMNNTATKMKKKIAKIYEDIPF